MQHSFNNNQNNINNDDNDNEKLKFPYSELLNRKNIIIPNNEKSKQ